MGSDWNGPMKLVGLAANFNWGIFTINMNKNLIIVFLLALASLTANAVNLDFYLPEESYNSNVPTPESILGYQVGDWHVRHDQLVSFYKALASSSDRVTLETIGRSHENRELLHLVITSANNQGKLADIKTRHLARLSAKQKPDASEYPLIVNLNYSVHGDESSGSNASMLVAYYLAASNNPKVLEYLDNMVIVLDPSLNPDGLSRFAQWANQHKGMNLNSDGNNREHVQDWIRGRVNHYWFDLNRDWLLLQHPESRARIAKYHDWRPNVLTDHHEMGTHSTFFFQPGIPSRKNPYTPTKNVELTKALANFHADAFDKQNELYFTEEAFDDFYAGKGSTYPDLHGSIGILFEQASSRGHLQESINGDLDFPTTIKNQVTASFSTLEGSLAHKTDLLDFQWQFAREASELADKANHDGYILSESLDKSRFTALLSLLNRHDIKAYPLTRDVKIGGKNYPKEHSVYVPLEQPQVRLIQSIFSEQKSFNDNTFYDVSSWNLAMAYNVDFAKVKSQRSVKIAKQEWQANNVQTSVLPEKANYSFAIDWADYQSPALIYALLKEGIELRTSMKAFTAHTETGLQSFAAGTMLVNAGLQNGDWYQSFKGIVAQYPVKVAAITSGMSPLGSDLGSRTMVPVKLPKVLIVGGLGANLYEVGEAWYLFDRHVGFSPTIVDKRRINNIDLAKYTHVILTDGSFSKSDDTFAKALKTWVKNGGIVWGQKRGALWLAEQELLKVAVISQSEMRKRFDDKGLAYDQMETLAGRQRIAGAFFKSQLDMSHPMAFGFSRDVLPLFKNRTDLLLEPEQAFTQVARYTESPLAAGYADEVNVEKISGATGVMAQSYGQGVVIGMTDDPNFRAIMYGTSRLLFNALFVAQGIDN